MKQLLLLLSMVIMSCDSHTTRVETETDTLYVRDTLYLDGEDKYKVVYDTVYIDSDTIVSDTGVTDTTSDMADTVRIIVSYEADYKILQKGASILTHRYTGGNSPDTLDFVTNGDIRVILEEYKKDNGLMVQLKDPNNGFKFLKDGYYYTIDSFNRIEEYYEE